MKSPHEEIFPYHTDEILPYQPLIFADVLFPNKKYLQSIRYILQGRYATRVYLSKEPAPAEEDLRRRGALLLPRPI